MNDAEKLREKPDEEFSAVLADLPRVSAASKSTARHDRTFEDGSSLVVTSTNGGPVEYEVRKPPKKKDAAAAPPA